MAKLLDEQAKLPPQGLLARVFGITPLGPESAPWYKGALGEIEVGKVLGGLGPGWEVLHAVPVGKADTDIDHVVIGPAGVFTLNTKNHSGQKVWVGGSTFMVNGARHPYVPNAVYEARRASRLLSKAAGRDVPVSPLLVLVQPGSLTIKKRPDGVEIVKAGNLWRWFSRQPHTLQATEVEHIAAAARAPGAWHEKPQGGEESAAVTAGFTSLRGRVRNARLRRMAWGLAIMGGIVAAMGLVAIPVLGSLFARLTGG